MEERRNSSQALAVGISLGVITLIGGIIIYVGRKQPASTSFNPGQYGTDIEGSLAAIDDYENGRITFSQLQKVLALSGESGLLTTRAEPLALPKPASPLVQVKEAPKPEPVASGKPSFTTYDNEVKIQLYDIDPVTFMPRQIIVHREAKVIG